MMLGAGPEKIATHHRERRVYVYVRQSSPKQVQHNRESQANQYALVQRARELGWPPDRIHVIDSDLGVSSQDADRAGFQELVAAVSLGHAGLVLAYEASRLARNNAEWYRLLEVATLVGTLIGDADGIYDPRTYNDRLLLGLRGMLSEAELHLLRLRLEAGRMRQVERGVYRQQLPTGLTRLPDGRVVKDPDQQVRHALELVFERFAKVRSCQKVLRSLRDDQLLLPRLQRAGPEAGRLLWRKPSDDMVYEILSNPAYAGAFVYGRHGPRPNQRPGHRPAMIRRRLEEWSTIQHGAYPEYISWEEYVANQARLADNAHQYNLFARGAPRDGVALLVGLATCGRCGRRMRTRYKPQPRYACTVLSKTYGDSSCVDLDATSIDEVVVGAFFEAIRPAELDVLEEVLAEQQSEHARVAQQYADRTARAMYEARLAQRQYEAVDPDNRLVAAELERRWELALRALTEAREAAEQFAKTPPPETLDPALRSTFQDVGQQLPRLWRSGRLSAAHKKELLRSLIRRVILRRTQPDVVEVKVVWVSGAFTTFSVRPPLLRMRDLGNYHQLVERVRILAAEGYCDADIAQMLTDEGFRAARRRSGIGKTLVLKLRRATQQPSLTEQLRHQAKLDDEWTVWGLSRELQVDRNWLYVRMRAGTLPYRRHPRTGHYLIADDPTLINELRQQASTRRRR
jgi:DNA invertase Pin-like site-specific DNA recombinase